jgi:hypothetical protein
VNRRRLSVAAAAVLAVTAGGCGGVQTLSYPPPPPTTAAPVATRATLPGNLSAVDEAAIPGATTLPPPAIGPGSATLNGTVLGPSGPVAGATVEADRLVGNQQASARTTTAADGSWSISSILGGRYRVRAWQSPGLTLLTPQVLFLSNGQVSPLTLDLTSFTGPDVAAAIAPGVIVDGRIDNLVVQVTNPTVGPDGVVRDVPEAGVSVALTDGPEWDVYNGNPRNTGANGDVLFQVSCQAVGSIPLAADPGTGTPVPLQLPPCVAAPTTTTTTTTVPVVPTIPCPTTSTSTPRRPHRHSTTTTTSPFGSC